MSIKNQHGIALLTVIMFLFILSLTWMDSEKASYVAEAGIQQALWLLSDSNESPSPWDWQSWPDNYNGTGGTKIIQGSLTYYQWNGKLENKEGTDQTYTVQIRNDGEIQSKIKAGSPNLDSPKRTIEVELGSAFDFGLYSHDKMAFSSGFTVSGANSTGYAYAKNGITNPTFLTADKKVGNYSTAPLFLPKEIPLPACGTPRFQAKITGTPTATTVRYVSDTGEETLGEGALLRNKTKNNFRVVQNVDMGSNTITTEVNNDDNWAAGDEIVLERIDRYEEFWETLKGLLLGLDNNCAVNPNQTCTDNIDSDTQFSAALVDFQGIDQEFNANIIIDNDVLFSGSVTINAPLYVKDGSITIASGANVVIGSNGGIFVRQENLTSNGTFSINGYCYVNGDITINNTSDLKVELPTAPDTTTILFSRNGSFTISSSFSFQNFSGWGKIIAGNKVTISRRLLTTDSTKPMNIVAMGDMEVGDRGIGSWSSPFCGVIYCGGKLYHTHVWMNPRTRVKGLLMAGTYYYKYPNNSEDKFFFSGYVTYDKNMKQDMPALGFTNNEDFARPLLWRDTTE